jgi:hypothetical protein
MSTSDLRTRIDSLLADIRRRRQILISPHELWGEPLSIHYRDSGGGIYICTLGQRLGAAREAHA